ncbi:restriction endonuclease subunit S [Ligilactobacillus salivarius]|uniref:restriction endonuclease subunit S n=1 Tax=Ligilactobacillus salivarius TaxID=1624 RepID=UPI0029D412A1|nr:restriction endonuclease subunit S [Ligilactobacillus salivarius]
MYWYCFTWERKKLGDVAEIVGGGTPSTTKDNYWNGSINWYTPAEIGDKIFIDNSQRKITNLGLKNSSAKILPAGTMLFTSRAGIGKTAILKEEGSTNQGFQSIIPNVKLLDSYFIYSMSNILKKYGESHGAGSTFIEISGKELAKAKIFLPSLIEQKYISKIIYSIDDTIQLHERKCEELTLIKKALLQKLFPKKDVIKPEVRYKNFNDAWEQRRFKDISKLSQGLQIAISKRFTHPGDGKLFYITNEFLNPNSTVKYYIDSPTKNVIAEKTDILMTRTGNTGKVVTDVEGVYHNNFFKISYNSSKIDRWFLYYLLNSYPIQREILVRAGNSTIPDLNHNDFYGIKIYIPTIEEQIKIGTFLTKVDSLIALHQYKLKKLKQLKKFLLQNMFI